MDSEFQGYSFEMFSIVCYWLVEEEMEDFFLLQKIVKHERFTFALYFFKMFVNLIVFFLLSGEEVSKNYLK